MPGLIPINQPVPGDTIDNRQLGNTYNFLAVVTDTWKLDQQRQFVFSGFYRNYALTLRSNFGDGLIQQSETRNVFGGQALYTQSVRSWLAVLAGLDLRRDAPRNLNLYHIDTQNQQQLTTSLAPVAQLRVAPGHQSPAPAHSSSTTVGHQQPAA